MPSPRSPAVRLAALAAAVLLSPQTTATAAAQTPAAPASPVWSGRVSAATYVFGDDDNYVQPTVAADRGPLHLEGRYNYEDRRSASGFVGWNFELGETVALQVTPMFGAVTGDTDGVIPALEFSLSFRRLEVYSEGEYVIDLNHERKRFAYTWSEVSVGLTEWLRAGAVIQRTRVVRRPLDLHRGILAGVSVGRLDTTAYFFNPWSDDFYFVGSVSMSF
jgi:hypothetical protein